jgi:hypothetical protein
MRKRGHEQPMGHEQQNVGNESKREHAHNDSTAPTDKPAHLR